MGNEAKRKKVSLIFLFLLIFFLLLLCTASCNTVDPPPDKAVLTLTLEDVSCTDAWITLTTNNLQLPATLNLLKDNTITKTINLQSADTLIYIDALLPNQTYNFHSVIQAFNQSSNEISVTTMDTTSHDFTFETWTFGGTAGSSTLYDVAIISENNIWAVGEILVADSTPNGHTTYNAVHWDGNHWNLKRIFFPTVCGSSNLTSYRAKAIFAFDDGQIWISSSGDKIARLKDNIQINQFCLPDNVSMSINKIWGTSGNDLYVVGSGGNIAHYNGSQWKKIESGTNLHIYDIWGEYNEKQDSYEINLLAAEHLIGPRRKIFKIKNNSVEELSTSGIPDGSLYGLWFKSDRKYYVVGNGIYSKNSIEDWSNWTSLHNGLTSYYIYGIRGSALNNIFLCGSFGETLHFNGVSWKSFSDTPGFYDVEFLNADVKENIIVAVGYSGSQAFLTIGKR